jgi:hypothetical protein
VATAKNLIWFYKPNIDQDRSGFYICLARPKILILPMLRKISLLPGSRNVQRTWLCELFCFALLFFRSAPQNFPPKKILSRRNMHQERYAPQHSNLRIFLKLLGTAVSYDGSRMITSMMSGDQQPKTGDQQPPPPPPPPQQPQPQQQPFFTVPGSRWKRRCAACNGRHRAHTCGRIQSEELDLLFQ